MLNDDKALAVCEQIAQGASARSACLQLQVCRSELYDALASNPSIADRYARACEMRADAKADEIDDIADSVMAGDVTPEQGRVAIEARKWTAAKLRPKRYGDRIQSDVDLTVHVTVTNPFALQASATLEPAVPLALPPVAPDE